MRTLTEDELKKIYADAKVIAVVGASTDPEKPSHNIPRYLQTQGYRIIPVTPKGDEIFGEKVYASLADIEEHVDVVDVFRPAEEAPEIATQAAEIGASVLWLQSGIVSEEAAQIAEAAGMQVVMGRCIGMTHAALGLGPGPS